MESQLSAINKQSPNETAARTTAKTAAPSRGLSHPAIQLQSRIGNRAFGRILPAKLAISQPGDQYEQEADRVADQIMRMPDPATPTVVQSDGPPQVSRLQRKCAQCEEEQIQRQPMDEKMEEEEESTLQTKEAAGQTPQITPAAQARISGLQGGGAPLPASVRNFFEPRFGHDFSQVRIHTYGAAAESAREVNAMAYTMGRDIVFGQGHYAPDAPDGRRLLAHELTHTLQQSAAGGATQAQRACDTTLLSSRTAPVFFPRQHSIMQVFDGTETLHQGTTRFAATGLVQQALVDLGFDLGTSGPNGDGVDRRFETLTKQAVADFQTAETIPAATPGVVDQVTIKCLDETRSKTTVPVPRAASITDDQFQVLEQESGGRNEDIFFERGSSTLDADDEAKIATLAAAHKGCPLTLKGFISEDELVDFGASLATDRLSRVDAKFAAEHHSDPGVCTPPSPLVTPLRAFTPMPDDSGGVPTYRERRKVEVVAAGATSTTSSCIGVPGQRPLDAATEQPDFDAAVSDGVSLMTTVIGKLVPGDPDGNAALTSFFGSTSKRATVKGKLQIWRNHVDSKTRTHGQRGADCNSDCGDAIAFNKCSSSLMTACGSFFNPGINEYPGLTAAQQRALVLIHEAGHGSLCTEDIAYDTGRLIHFIGRTPALALKNTDSYVTLIRCLTGLLTGCALTPPGDTPLGGLSATELEKAQDGIAWLETWLTWAEQDVNGLYGDMNEARKTPSTWASSDYNKSVLGLFSKAFELHRPFAALPTFREQTMVAGVWDRYRSMSTVASSDLEIEKDTSATPVQRWQPGGGSAPGTKVFLTDAYLTLTTPRARVEMLLPMIVEATPGISSSLRSAYVTFVKETVRLTWGNHP